MLSFKKYYKLLKKTDEPSVLIGQIQEAVSHAASLSRYFWPPINKKSNEAIQDLRNFRAKQLRGDFRLADTSALTNRDLRNEFDHFEEKLDIYLLSTDSGYFFPTPIIGSHQLADDPISRIFKLLDVKTECLVLLNKKFFFQPIYEEVEKIYYIAIENSIH